MKRAPAPPHRRHRLTRADYHRMAEVGILANDARVELIDGEIIDLPPIGAQHGSFFSRINCLLTEAAGERAIVQPQNPVVFSDYSEPAPDLALLKPRPDCYLRAIPEPADVMLLVEVSAGSIAYDCDIKGPLYARHGIPVYWVLDLSTRQLLCHEVPRGEGYRLIDTFPLEGRISLPGLQGCEIDLSVLASVLAPVLEVSPESPAAQ